MFIKLGDRVKDSVSGFEGIAIARTTWLNGCVRWTLQPAIDKDGDLPSPQTFDEYQLTVAIAQILPAHPSVYAPAEAGTTGATGGDRTEPQRHPSPTR